MNMKNWIIKRKKIISILIGVVLIAVAVGIYYFIYLHSAKTPVLNTYFNPDYKYSIVIPSEWVGKIAIQEIKKGDVAFVYLGDGKTSFPIFSIDVIQKNQWIEIRNIPGSPLYIAEKGDNVFTYQIATANPFEKIGKNYSDEFIKFTSQVPEVVKTLNF